jgi:hypothetical protein
MMHDIRFPTITLRGWLSGLLGAAKSKTTVAPNENKLSSRSEQPQHKRESVNLTFLVVQSPNTGPREPKSQFRENSPLLLSSRPWEQASREAHSTASARKPASFRSTWKNTLASPHTRPESAQACYVCQTAPLLTLRNRHSRKISAARNEIRDFIRFHFD